MKIIKDLDSLRAKDLKKYLINDLGYAREQIDKILDKKELRLIAEAAIQSTQEFEATIGKVGFDRSYSNWALVKVGVTAVLGVIVLYQIREPILDFLGEKKTSYVQRWKMFKITFKRWLILPSICILITVLLDVYQVLIQLQILLGWGRLVGLRFDEYIVRVPVLSMSLSPSQLVGTQRGDDQVSSFINSGLNVGPMITMWMIGYVKHRFEEFSSKYVLQIVQEKEHKKEARRQAKAAKESSTNESMPGSSDQTPSNIHLSGSLFS
jgi:hypothetical protein